MLALQVPLTTTDGVGELEQLSITLLWAIAAAAAAFLFAGGAAYAGLGQPSDWQIGLQQSATPVMDQVAWFHSFLLWIITFITGFVLVLLVMLCVLFVATVFQALGRTIVLMVLTAIAPIALALHALPQTDQIARLWWRSTISCLAVPVVQAFFLTAGQWLLLDPSHQLPVFGLTVEPGGVVNLMIVIVLLAVTVKIPKLMRRYAGGGNSGGGSAVATAARVVVVGGLSRAVPGVGRLARVVR